MPRFGLAGMALGGVSLAGLGHALATGLLPVAGGGQLAAAGAGGVSLVGAGIGIAGGGAGRPPARGAASRRARAPDRRRAPRLCPARPPGTSVAPRMAAMNPRLADFLTAHRAEFRVVTHPEAFTAQEEAAAAHVSGWSWGKVVVLKKPDAYLLAVLPAACLIDLTRLKGLVGEAEVAFASVEEIRAACPGSEPGAVPPFGRLWGMETVLDQMLVDRPALTLPAGDHRTAIEMRTTEYLRLADPRVGPFAVTPGVAGAR
jgi:Ala-tRNA(Pro) deacylase